MASSLFASGKTVVLAEIAVNHLHYQSDPKHVAQKRRWKIDAINHGLREDPVLLNYLLGVELFHSQDFSAAASRFEDCRQQCEIAYAPELFYYHALALINIQDCPGAAKILEEGADLYPDYTDLQYLLAIARFMMGNTKEAERMLRRCLEKGDTPWQKHLANPGTGSFKAMCSLGTVLTQQGNVAEALELLMKAAQQPGGPEQAIEGIIVLR